MASNDEQYSSEEGVEIDWVPAYWTPEEKGEVRDVTGGQSCLPFESCASYCAAY